MDKKEINEVKELIKNYLKENLSISISTTFDSFEGKITRIDVGILLDGETIAEAYDLP